MKRKAIVNIVGISLSIVYFLAFFYLVFLDQSRKHLTGRFINLVPFQENIAHYHKLTPSDPPEIVGFYMNLYGNIALFIPLAIILLWLFRVRNKAKVVLIAFLVSLTIEIIQYVLKIGTADIDDLILNTIGATIGVLLYTLAEKIVTRKHAYKEASQA